MRGRFHDLGSPFGKSAPPGFMGFLFWGNRPSTGVLVKLWTRVPSGGWFVFAFLFSNLPIERKLGIRSALHFLGYPKVDLNPEVPPSWGNRKV